MQRRVHALLPCLLVGSLAGSVHGQGADAGQPPRRPNVFLIMADDMSWFDCGAYGSQDARTPHIDRLSQQGMAFTRAYTATAMCAPTRQHLYTGLFPVRNGAYPQGTDTHAGIRSIPHYFRPLGYRVGIHGKQHFGPPENFPFEDLKDTGALDLESIREFVTRDHDQPYFLVVCSHEPHLPYTKGDPAHFDPRQLTLPPSLVDTPKTREFYAQYLAEIEYLDGEVGQCMDLVKASGTATDTIFVFCSEQGSAFPFGKWTCYETGMKQAFIVRWPEHVTAGTTSDAMVQCVDLVPTLLDAAGGDPAAGDFDGRSYLDVLTGKRTTHNEFVFGVHTTRGISNGSECYPVRSVRDERYKLILNLNHETNFQNNVVTEDRFEYWKEWTSLSNDSHAASRVRSYQVRPEAEFYDLQADSWEMNNLIRDPKYAKRVVLLLRKQIELWMKQQGDLGIVSELAAKAKRRR